MLTAAGRLSPSVRETAVVRVVGADDFDVLTAAGSLSPSAREAFFVRGVGADDFDMTFGDQGWVVGAGVEVVGCARS